MEEASFLVYDVNTVVVTVRCQDVTLDVCGDAARIECFPGSIGKTVVSKAEFAGHAGHF